MTTPRPSVAPAVMRVRLHLKPGQKGAKRLLAQYGDRLVCFRYRYDPERGKRFKTIELLVAERDWSPFHPAPPADRLVPVRVAFPELAVRQQVKQAGGTWNPDGKVWELRYDRAVALGLEDRIVPDGGLIEDRASDGRCLGRAAGASTRRCESASTPRCRHPRVDASICR